MVVLLGVGLISVVFDFTVVIPEGTNTSVLLDLVSTAAPPTEVEVA